MTGTRVGFGTVLTMLTVFGPAQSQSIFSDGFESPCSAEDLDSDRLTGCQETDAFTDPSNPDTDSDGLRDGDEVLGTAAGLDLPALGTNPRRKDLLLEIDWDDDDRGCGFHSHRPSAEALAEVEIFFAAAPVANPDGSTGINFIADAGQGPAPFNGGNVVDFQNGVTSRLEQPFFDVKFANFAAARIGYFRYQVHAHYWADGEPSSGYGNLFGDNSVVTLNCSHDSSDHVRNTIIHELGHNLGLFHGGNSVCNGLPNYNSLMNYNHQFKGIDVTCDRLGDGIDNLGYSHGTRTTMIQHQLNEAQGLCPLDHPLHQAVDWNGNGVIDGLPVSFPGLWSISPECDGITMSADHDDYAALIIKPQSPPGGGAPTPSQDSGACAPIPEE